MELPKRNYWKRFAHEAPLLEWVRRTLAGRIDEWTVFRDHGHDGHETVIRRLRETQNPEERRILAKGIVLENNYLLGELEKLTTDPAKIRYIQEVSAAVDLGMGVLLATQERLSE